MRSPVPLIRTKAPGSIFLLGEHAVGYGRCALIAAIDLYTQIEMQPHSSPTISVQSQGYGHFSASLEELISTTYHSSNPYTEKIEPLRDLIGSFLRTHHLNEGFTAAVTSHIPPRSGGMSSSSAVLCALLKALCLRYNIALEPADYFFHLHPFQKRIHGGAASGSEILSSSLGGMHFVEADNTSSPPNLHHSSLSNNSLGVVIGDTGIEAPTIRAVQWIAGAYSCAMDDYNAVFDSIAQLVIAGRACITAGDIAGLGELMNRNHDLLASDLGISHPCLNRLVALSRQSGAVGAKLTGGGCGGAMIALAEPLHLTRIAAALRNSGAECYCVHIGAAGVAANVSENIGIEQ